MGNGDSNPTRSRAIVVNRTSLTGDDDGPDAADRDLTGGPEASADRAVGLALRTVSTVACGGVRVDGALWSGAVGGSGAGVDGALEGD
ncbi:hypothetical protein P875_00108735 [Aspergillus parasiticus SU-1]|uniref:Uncharacterized protein n=1 Tax=Aspergillus parasiticus (strain ATCC 56775 / NRRL 5862 / SRRC 143 / SU-1) TaxID=1403190 RepID=A0A0F0IMM4_ASPPU|nr:hypothetical protein P875_00108735 [Aspergillus parasiticus SU-1]